MVPTALSGATKKSIEEDAFRPPSDTEDNSNWIQLKGPKPIRTGTPPPEGTETLSNKILRKAQSIALRRAKKFKYKKEKKVRRAYCEVCDIHLNSQASKKDHLNGSKHKARLALQLESYKCQICDLNLCTKIELDRHRSGKRHRQRENKHP